MKRGSLEDRAARASFRLEARRDSATPLTTKERIQSELIRHYFRVSDWALWLGAFRFESLGRAFHQLSGNRIASLPPHETTDNVTASEYLADMPSSWKKARPPSPRPASPAIELAAPRAVEGSLDDMLAQRRSVRRYGQRALTLDEVSTFLGASFGARIDQGRTYPSGGALYSIEAFYVPLRDEPSGALPAGAYRYAAEYHMAVPAACAEAPLAQMLMPDATIDSDPAALVFFVADFTATEKKYGELGYRLAMLEAGHMGQNAYLVATAMNLGCVALGVGNFRLWHVNRRLGLDGVDRTVVHAMALGPRDLNA